MLDQAIHGGGGGSGDEQESEDATHAAIVGRRARGACAVMVGFDGAAPQLAAIADRKAPQMA